MTIQEQLDGRILLVDATGKLTREDYQRCMPTWEALAERHGKLRILVRLHDFHGWDAGGIWEDLKAAARHFDNLERMAVIGETRWQEALTKLAKPITEVGYFQPGQDAQALAWLSEDLPDP